MIDRDHHPSGGGDSLRAAVPYPQTQVLVGRVRRGDAHAMDALYRRLYPKMRACALLALGGDHRRTPDVDDAVQQAFTDAFRVLAEGTGFADDSSPGAFRNYLARIIRNLIFGEARRRARRGGGERSFESVYGGTDPRCASADAGPATVAGDREAFAQVETELASLEEKDRRVITLRYLCGLTSAEICAEMTMPGGEPGAGFRDEAQVRWTLYRAMERLRRRLGARENLIHTYFRALGDG